MASCESVRNKGDSRDAKESYMVGSVLGQGGFGVVRSAVRLIDGRPIAIKSVPKSKVVAWHQLVDGRSVPREVALLQRLSSVQGVLSLLDFSEQPDSFELILDRPAWSQDLFDFITSRGWLEEKLARHFLKQIVTAVKHCRKLGVVHRDIKDENVVVDLRNHDVFLIDFGSGHWYKSSLFDDFDGTRVYAPPEFIIEGRYNADEAAVWSLGILLHDMVIGDVPFETDEQICEAQLNLPKHLSANLQNLLKLCLQKAPTNRILLELIEEHGWMDTQNDKMTKNGGNKDNSSNGIPIRNAINYSSSDSSSSASLSA